MKRIILLTVILLATVAVLPQSARAQDKNLSVEEILARHLRSFGPAEAIEKSRSRMAVGTVEYTMAGLTEQRASGKAELASNGADLRLISTFDLREYPRERIGLFGNKITIPFVEQTHRSALGAFLNFEDRLLTARLFGGSIFSTWPFYRSDTSGLKLKADGKKGVGDREAWVIKITPKGGSVTDAESFIKLYFDTKDFHHIRTVYHLERANIGLTTSTGSIVDVDPRTGWPTPSVLKDGRGQLEGWIYDIAHSGRTDFTEDFDSFASDAAGVSLPHNYSVLLRAETENGAYEFKWVFKIEEYKPIDLPANYFSFNN